MNYYTRHVGDYHAKAGGLTMLEHGAYTLLLDACYNREKFPTEEQAIEWTYARTDEEVAAVKAVLKRFFCMNNEGEWEQRRVDDELTKYRHKSQKAQESGRRGGKAGKRPQTGQKRTASRPRRAK